MYTPEQQAEWQQTAALIRQIEDRLRDENPDWAERMAAWEETVRNDQPEWTIVRPQLDVNRRSETLLAGRRVGARRRIRADDDRHQICRRGETTTRSRPCAWSC